MVHHEVYCNLILLYIPIDFTTSKEITLQQRETLMCSACHILKTNAK